MEEEVKVEDEVVETTLEVAAEEIVVEDEVIAEEIE